MMVSEITPDKLTEGIEKAKKSADRHLERAIEAFKQEDYQVAYFYGFSAWEESGKALMIQEKIGQSISRQEWTHVRSFRGHKAKIEKADEEDRKAALIRIKKQAQELFGHTDVELKESDVSKYPLLRNKVLHLDYDFDNDKWESPINIEDLKKKAVLVIIRARSARTLL